MGIVNLVSKDGIVYEVPRNVAIMSQLVKNALGEGDHDEDERDTKIDIPLPNVSAVVLRKVIEYCKHFQEDEMRSLQPPPKSGKLDELVQEWYAEFVQVDTALLLDLIAAADYMNINPLRDLTCLAVSIMVEGKSAKELRDIFSVSNEYSANEQVQMERENARSMALPPWGQNDTNPQRKTHKAMERDIQSAVYGYNEESESAHHHMSLDRSMGASRRRLNVTSEVAPTADVRFRTNKVLFYSPPRQRQKWGETQVLPRVIWGDLFFDLFYVAATYNVSYIIVDAPNRDGVLYAAGTFFPVMAIWNQKTFFDSRYAGEDDVIHRLLDCFIMLVLGVAVSRIRFVGAMSNAAGDPSMFIFALMLMVDRLFAISLYLEVYFNGVGQKQLKYATMREALLCCVGLFFYAAASVVAAVEYFGNSVNGSDRRLADPYGSSALTIQTTNTPIYLCLIGHITFTLLFFGQIVFWFPSGGRHKEISVPINVDFVIHRMGEWNMLMFGESIFSLLVVVAPDEDQDFFTVFYMCLLTVIFIQLLHFQSQHHIADKHAMRRHKDSGCLWNLIQQLFSFSFVMLGACFTFFLTSSGTEGRRRRLESQGTLNFQSVADLFSASLSLIFFCLHVINLLHLGKEEAQKRCMIKGKQDWKGMTVSVTHLVLIAASATLSQWTKEPRDMSFAGLFLVLAQLSLRKLESSHFLPKPSRLVTTHADATIAIRSDDETGEAPWPDVTHARVKDDS